MYVVQAQYFEKIEAQDISAQNITEQPGCAKLIVVYRKIECTGCPDQVTP